jgi:hypothetical protein
MCFEWDKRYFREQEELRICKEKTDEMLKRAEEAAKAESANAAPVVEREEAAA